MAVAIEAFAVGITVILLAIASIIEGNGWFRSIFVMVAGISVLILGVNQHLLVTRYHTFLKAFSNVEPAGVKTVYLNGHATQNIHGNQKYIVMANDGKIYTVFLNENRGIRSISKR